MTGVFHKVYVIFLGPWILLFLLSGEKTLPRKSADIRHFAQMKISPFLKFPYTYRSTKMLNTVNRDENAILYAVSLVLGCPSETQSHHKAKEIPIIKLQSEKISCNLEHRCFLGLMSTREMFLSGKYKKIVPFPRWWFLRQAIGLCPRGRRWGW